MQRAAGPVPRTARVHARDQLHAPFAAQVFRSENSLTHRHMCEFTAGLQKLHERRATPSHRSNAFGALSLPLPPHIVSYGVFASAYNSATIGDDHDLLHATFAAQVHVA